MPDSAVEKTRRPPNLHHSPAGHPSEPELATVPWALARRRHRNRHHVPMEHWWKWWCHRWDRPTEWLEDTNMEHIVDASTCLQLEAVCHVVANALQHLVGTVESRAKLAFSVRRQGGHQAVQELDRPTPNRPRRMPSPYAWCRRIAWHAPELAAGLKEVVTLLNLAWWRIFF